MIVSLDYERDLCASCQQHYTDRLESARAKLDEAFRADRSTGRGVLPGDIPMFAVPKQDAQARVRREHNSRFEAEQVGAMRSSAINRSGVVTVGAPDRRQVEARGTEPEFEELVVEDGRVRRRWNLAAHIPLPTRRARKAGA